MTSYTTSDSGDLPSTFSDTDQDWGEEDVEDDKGNPLMIVRPVQDAVA